MATKLEEIVAAARRSVATSGSASHRRSLEAAAREHEPRGFRRALQAAGQNRPAIIAELKKASPSKGLIRRDFPVAELAGDLTEAGAAALSVLTNEPYFQGSLENLEIASRATTIPCLRKDFIVDTVQLLEARAHRADAVLLIVAALSQQELVDLDRAAHKLELDVLCEVHDETELWRALDAGCDLVGVNNRNLHTFKVDIQTSFELCPKIPPSIVKVAESGIETGDDIARLRQAGFDAFLIGETLMRAPRPGDALRGLLAHTAAAL